MSLGYGRLSATRQRLGLGVDFKHPPRKGAETITTRTVMRETLIMRDNLRMTDRG